METTTTCQYEIKLPTLEGCQFLHFAEELRTAS
jgi:hypothetical protein